MRGGARSNARFACVFAALIAALGAITVLNINIGSVPIPVGEIARILFAREFAG